MREVSEYAEVFMSLLAVSTPLAMCPVFLALTAGFEPQRVARNARQAALTFFIVGLVSVYVGEALFKIFSIGIPSFRVAGGVLVFLTALGMVREGAPEPSASGESSAAKKDVGVVPMGIPLLAGPGTISVILIQSHEFESHMDNLILAGMILLVALVCWFCLVSAGPISGKLGRQGLDVTTRVFGLILAALAVEFIATGLVVLFPQWG